MSDASYGGYVSFQHPCPNCGKLLTPGLLAPPHVCESPHSTILRELQAINEKLDILLKKAEGQ